MGFNLTAVLLSGNVESVHKSGNIPADETYNESKGAERVSFDIGVPLAAKAAAAAHVTDRPAIPDICGADDAREVLWSTISLFAVR